jgi:hypothetical protein
MKSKINYKRYYNFKKMKKSLSIFILFLSIVWQLSAQGGMWLPNSIKGDIEHDMQSLGMKLTADEIYSDTNSSIKDAIVQFGGGCTGEVISPKGLILTNHHCGYGAIQRLSTMDNNLLKNGFWAQSFEEELPAKGLTVTFIDKIEDVTDKVLADIDDNLPLQERQSLIDKNIDSLSKTTEIKEYQTIEIKPFYYGNKYYLFIKNIFKDIRLVGVCPESIGKFGADTDNWMWPRHNADFSIFRIYADKNNLPAEYSKDNVPYSPKHYLPISTKEINEDDFTLVFGFPGRTQEYLPAIAVDQIANKLDPVRISIREAALNVMDKYMRKDEATRLKYASKFAGIANYWKKWIGESQGINRVHAVTKKKEMENEFMKRLVNNHDLKTKYGNLLTDFDSLYTAFEPYNIAQNTIYESFYRSIDFMRVMSYLNRLIKYYDNNGIDGYNKFKSRLLPYLKGMYKGLDVDIDKEVFAVLVKKYALESRPEFVPASIKKLKTDKDFEEFANSIYVTKLADYNSLESIIDTSDIEWTISMFEKEPGFVFAKEINEISDTKVSPYYSKLSAEINDLQKIYMKALMEMFPEKSFFPDANSTLRITYGQVKGYHPRDAVYYEPVSHIEGVIEKYKPGDYEFDLPGKFIDIYKAKDFNGYTDKSGSVPVCFIATNHTTGGNSGSPALDAKGNLIGLNFDRVWEGTMSDLYYDPSICRNIMVDVRYILFLIGKYGNAQRLLNEMKIVK